ncbi:Protein of unknown function DUF581 [Macleaya cordata]|uniref:FLZ-type domain-containing protein n=1 Tax=Macleaya cordata TaxID=56857 RepID=A0A200QD62_MACCD|nr:Protein of unknown function DUF581 [Macleaya cordata]
MSSTEFSEPFIPGIKTLKMSTRCSKSTRDIGSGIGLGIVAALDNFGGTDSKKIPTMTNINIAMGTTGTSPAANLNPQSHPISIGGSAAAAAVKSWSTMKGDHEDDDDFAGGDHLNRWRSKVGVFNYDESPPRFYYDDSTRSRAAFPPSDFLNSCNLCRKKLNGRDIYMYRGEKAFCSTECRYRHIVTDEHKEKYSGNEVVAVSSRSSVDMSAAAAAAAGSPAAYMEGQLIFSTGIIAI